MSILLNYFLFGYILENYCQHRCLMSDGSELSVTNSERRIAVNGKYRKSYGRQDPTGLLDPKTILK